MRWLPFLATWGLPFVIYVALQLTAVFRLSGKPRLVSLIPVLPMLGVVVATVRAYEANSNLWPILLVLGSPIADLFLGVLLLQSRKSIAAAKTPRITDRP